METLEFQAETRQLMQLMIHSIYSNKDIFLRELISNGSDALDKLRIESLVDSDLDVDRSDLHVALTPDADARTLTVSDNGIGMTRDEVVSLIGTIAKSGTAELLRTLREASAESADLIGQFGVGFYSSFMVADRVTLVTRKAGESTGTRWESTGEGTYTIDDVDDAPQGTAVTLHLKPADAEDQLHDYADPAVLTSIVKKYSDFIAWPIRLDGTAINSQKALWARPRSEVTAEEYNEFYKHVSHDWTDPLETIHMKAEGTFEYDALLFLPSRAPFDLYSRDAQRGVQLYVKRVFIMADCEALVPSYLRFVKGVVDAADLSLNVSREILQQDRQIQAVRRRLVRKVLGTIKELPAEKYATFWAEFGRALKEGLIEDAANREIILDLLSFSSTRGSELTTLREYVERRPEGQTEIYYLTGDSRATIENSPHLEAFRAKGYEVLVLTDPVDEVWVDQVTEYDGIPLKSVAKGQVDLGDTAAETPAGFEDFLTWMSGALAESVKEVRLSTRLVDSPACVVGDADDLTPTLEKMFRAMGQPLPSVKRILELNPSHPLVTGLRDAFAAGTQDAEAAELLYGMALLAEGGELADPARFSRLLAERLTKTL
ncbi:molecular chaperone HtpG [Cryptosporangium arvum]|uniref:Chaperone protein HtpG n=1 Tax=Cryptosporangium arvum DSM 44712 TaxID=927661 RepID=A0A010YMY4_9ACTN|nr:molecular chaperone HtpG [Cryptosporangium arvum]EXG81570.1 molecular chaperone of HSP90 family [Cryptosporangium arvum DSM 44712]